MRRSVLLLVVLWIVVSSGCHERIIVYPPPQSTPEVSRPRIDVVPPANLPEPVTLEPVSPPKSVPPLDNLDMGDFNFRLGNYPQAIRNYEEYLGNFPQSKSKDRILFNIGLAHALSPGGSQNLPGAKKSLNAILKEFPESGYESQAKLILSLITQVEQLNLDVSERDTRIQRLRDELNRLKEIDLKRRPSRPKEQ